MVQPMPSPPVIVAQMPLSVVYTNPPQQYVVVNQTSPRDIALGRRVHARATPLPVIRPDTFIPPQQPPYGTAAPTDRTASRQPPFDGGGNAPRREGDRIPSLRVATPFAAASYTPPQSHPQIIAPPNVVQVPLQPVQQTLTPVARNAGPNIFGGVHAARR